jgi:hypothetical protein
MVAGNMYSCEFEDEDDTQRTREHRELRLIGDCRMDEKQLKDAERLYKNWSDGELLRATTAEKQSYEPWALDLMARELSRRDISHSEKESAEKEVLEQVESEFKRLTGVHGFLLLFVVVLVVNSLFAALFGLAFVRAGDLVIMLFGVLWLIFAGYGFSVVYLLIRKQSTAPQHAERLLILGCLLSIVSALVVWMVTPGSNLAPAFYGVIGALLWLGYLRSSRRVANTYGPPQDGV